MVVFIASNSPLPLVPWLSESPAFNVRVLSEHEERVRSHLSFPHVRCTGSHTSCGCGFNEGRQYRELQENPADLTASLESSSRLARYVQENRVEQIYSCWSGDEGEPQEFERPIAPQDLSSESFVFRERELYRIERDDN